MTDGNSALQFNGKGDFATATGTALYQASASFTVEAWVKIDAEKRDIFPILENADIELLLAVLGSHPSMYFRGNEIHARTHLEPGVWTHVAWSYNAKTREQAIYVNGVLDFSIPGDQLEAVFSRGDIQIGRDGDEYFCGELTEIRIWDAALAQPDIQNRMHLRLAGAESGLVECWPLNREHRLQNIAPRLPVNAQCINVRPREIEFNGKKLAVPYLNSPQAQIEIPHHPSIYFGWDDDFTVEAWVGAEKLGEPKTEFLWLVRNHQFKIALHADGGFVVCFRGDEPVFAAEDFPLFEHPGLHHVAFVKQERKLTLYIDGERREEREDRGGPVATPEPLRLCDIEQPGQAGLFVTKVRLWRTAVEPDQIHDRWNKRLKEVFDEGFANVLEESGLAGYWPLDPKQKDLGRNEIVPNTAAEFSGECSWNSNAGLPFPWVERQVVDFRRGFIEVDNYHDREFLEGLCVEAWVKPALSVQNFGQSPIVSAHVPEAGFELRCALSGAEFLITLDREHHAISIPQGPAYPMTQDRWVHLAAVYDRQAIHLYVNGVPATSEKVSAGSYTQSRHKGLSIGVNATKNFFEGQIAEVRLWERPRTGQEILRGLFESIQPNDEQDYDGLIGYWPLNDKAERVADKSPSRLTGKLHDANWVSGFLPPGLRSEVGDVGEDDPRQKTAEEKLNDLRAEKKEVEESLHRVTRDLEELKKVKDPPSLNELKKQLKQMTDTLALKKEENKTLLASMEGIEAWMDGQGAVPLKTVITNTEEQIAQARKEIAEAGSYRVGSVSMDLRFGLFPNGSAIFPKTEDLPSLKEPFSTLTLSFEEAAAPAAQDVVPVPDLTNQTETMARRTLASAGLQAETQFQVIKDQDKEMEGRVVGQSPTAQYREGNPRTAPANSIVRIFIGRTK